ncbi:hypothetical protein QX776_13830 [Alteromonadaceae bacterium BrNp21-10]|nr:hypothetical protein [Alteromonadaceae bacterium BrNp21-10]
MLKYYRNVAYVLVLLIVSVCTAAQSHDESAACDQSGRITFTANPIFDLTDNDSIFLHRWANFLHVDTKVATLKNEAAFFINKCEVNAADLAELERHLRNTRYIRDAKVEFDKDKHISVNTWDNWSLMPTLSAGRKGGKNKFEFGFQERNLLGLGINAKLEYFTDSQRSGYKLDTTFPLSMGNNTEANFRLVDSDDGEYYGAFLQKKFVSFDTPYAFKIGASESTFNDTIFQNGKDKSTFTHQTKFATAEGGWLYQDNQNSTLRFNVGLTQDSHYFEYLDAKHSIDEPIIPLDRDFLYPFIGIDYQQKDYRKLQNIHLINHIEDFNFGWQFTGKLGTSINSSQNAASLIWQAEVNKGFSLSPESLLLMQLQVEGEQYDTRPNRLLSSLTSEFFYRFNPQWAFHFKNTNVISSHQYIEDPVSLGGDTGLRGYPVQYQHGDKSILFNTEIRYYPHINIYKVLELGAVGFIDTGKAWDAINSGNVENKWLNSVGIGARLYSSHSSEAKVIHIDLAAPLSNSDSVNTYEFRVTTNYSF